MMKTFNPKPSKKPIFSFILLFLFFTASSQSIEYIDYGGKVPDEGFFDVRFNYSTSSWRDCVVSLKKPSENWRTYAWKKISVPPGSNTVKAVSLSFLTTPATGGGYVVEVKMLNRGTNREVAYKNVQVTVEDGKQGFHTWNGQLYDANSNAFLIRGINNAHADWDNYNRYYAYDALDNIDSHGFNTVRIQWRKYTTGGLSVSHLENIIQRCIAHNMVPMVELHDATGSSSVSQLHEMAQFWADNVWLLIKYRKYIVVNIANEWSPWGTAPWDWYQAYKGAIDIIRNAGFSGTLVVDAPAYAQDPNGIKWHGQDLLDHDPVTNLMFSLHMYAQWGGPNPDYDIVNELQAIKNLGLPLTIGEFAHKHPASGCTEVSIDFWSIMRECKKHDFGYLGWSWHGNGQGDCGISLSYLDVATSWDGASLSADWGNNLVNYNGYGIASTSVRATIFNGGFAGTARIASAEEYTENREFSDESGVYPNPFHDRATLRFSLPSSGTATVEVSDIHGKLMSVQQEAWLSSGENSLTLETASWPAGIYVYRITTPSGTSSGKMIRK